MTLQSFCEEYDWPPATASRLIRSHVFEQAFGREEPAEEVVRDRSLDLELEEAGIHVRKPAGNANLHYQIGAPDRTDQWLAEQANRPPLNDEQIDLLLRATDILVQADRGQGKVRLYDAGGERRMHLSEEFRTQLEGLLRRAGRLDR